MPSYDPPPTEAATTRRYETRDANLRAVLWLAASVFLLGAGSMIGLWALLGSYQSAARRSDPPPLAIGNADQTPPLPRLQNTPIKDYEDYRAEQDAILDTYGWVDRDKKTVRVPISRAMDMALEEGLPSPEAAPVQSEDAENEKKSEPPEDNP